jgi:hypothetical protein
MIKDTQVVKKDSTRLWPRAFLWNHYNTRHWKDHLKNDRRSDQDHRQKIERRSDQDHPFKKKSIFQDQIIYHFLPSKSPF